MNNVNTATQKNTKELALTSMMISIIVLMSLTPLGFLKTLGASISLLPIPVGIGAMILGPKVGAILGLTFGLMSFSQAFGSSPFSTMLFNINPLYTFILSVSTRTLMGFCVGVIFEKLHTKSPSSSVPYFVSGLMAAFLNTLFYMTMLIALFWNTEYIQTRNADLGGLNPFFFIIAFVGINGALEMPASCIIGGQIARVLKKVV